MPDVARGSCTPARPGYGKPFVLDLMDVDIWDEVQRDMDLIQFELMDKVLDQSILNERTYLSLVRQPGGRQCAQPRDELEQVQPPPLGQRKACRAWRQRGSLQGAPARAPVLAWLWHSVPAGASSCPSSVRAVNL